MFFFHSFFSVAVLLLKFLQFSTSLWARVRACVRMCINIVLAHRRQAICDTRHGGIHLLCHHHLFAFLNLHFLINSLPRKLLRFVLYCVKWLNWHLSLIHWFMKKCAYLKQIIRSENNLRDIFVYFPINPRISKFNCQFLFN